MNDDEPTETPPPVPRTQDEVPPTTPSPEPVFHSGGTETLPLSDDVRPALSLELGDE